MNDIVVKAAVEAAGGGWRMADGGSGGVLQRVGCGMPMPAFLYMHLIMLKGFPRADVDVPAIRADRQAIISAPRRLRCAVPPPPELPASLPYPVGRSFHPDAACPPPPPPTPLSTVLTNDHKALSGRVEQLLHQLHAATAAGSTSSSQQQVAAASAAAAPAAATTRSAVAPEEPAPARGAGGDSAQQGALPPPFAVIDELSADSPAEVAGLQLWDQLCSFAGVTVHTPGDGGTLQAVAAALAANEGRAVRAAVLRQGAPLQLLLTPQQWGGRGLLGCHLRPL